MLGQRHLRHLRKPLDQYHNDNQWMLYSSGQRKKALQPPAMGKPNDPQGITEDRKMNPEIEQPIDEEVEEKAVVRVSAMGEVKACAKGDLSGCGYKKGDKVCGKCGAMAVMTKGAPVEDEEQELLPTKKGMHRMPDGTMMNDEDMVDDEDEAKAKMAYEKMMRMRKGMHEDMDEDEEKMAMDYEKGMHEGMDDEDEESATVAKRKKMRTDRMSKIGVKDATDGHFMCAFDRKVLAPESAACEGCKGGCFAVKGGIDILEVEAIAEQQYDAEVVDSGYSDIFDRFVVDLRKKDGELIEAFYDGSGKDRGWQPIEEDSIAFAEDAISPDEAVDIAEGFIEGKSLTITVSAYEGGMSYCVELEGKDGYSYDIFVDPIEGKVLGADQWEYSTASVEPGMQKDDSLMASLMEFEALSAEEELREKGLI